MSNGLNNGYNEWGVALPKIIWFNQLLNSHGNVKNIVRRDDIIFEIDRLQQKDHLIMALLGLRGKLYICDTVFAGVARL